VLARRITRTIGGRYVSAMRWQTVAFSMFALGGFHEAIGTLFLNNDRTYEAYGFYLWPFIVTGFLFVGASYTFSLLTAREAAAETADTQPTDSDYIDSLVTVAGLASNPQEIDPAMDGMRLVTANLTPGDTLTDAQKQRLLGVYDQLEAYLTAKDPLRTYTTEEIREQVTPGFQAVLAKTHHA
jgi:hypothetical protein